MLNQLAPNVLILTSGSPTKSYIVVCLNRKSSNLASDSSYVKTVAELPAGGAASVFNVSARHALGDTQNAAAIPRQNTADFPKFIQIAIKS